MQKLSSILITAACAVAFTACDAQAPEQAQETSAPSEASADTEERSGQSMSVELFSAKKDACAYLVGMCLNDTYACLGQNDDGICSPSFEGCRDANFAKACKSDDKIDIGVNSTLRCWNKFDDCAATDADAETCAAELNTCVAAGSLCEVNAESECDAQLCDAEACEQALWNRRGRRGGGWPGGGWPGGSGGGGGWPGGGWPGGSGSSGGWPGGGWPGGGWPGGKSKSGGGWPGGGWPGGSGGGWPGGGWPGGR